ncbi:RDD family protein [Singulisphaera sp. Ch08]|uniref:RDD family protein n=1 Tax=Singulisphaera sp. Ch08 TaxID=3120278 RepID=A0AAU7CHV6_9BACT
MSVDNPYAAPEADLSVVRDPATDCDLAKRSTRMVAAFLDGLIGVAFAIPISFLLGTWNYISVGQEPPLGITLAASVLGFLAFLLIHGSFLKANGQTFGKKMTGIRVADLDGNIPNFGKLILWRYLPISVAAVIPLIGPYLSVVNVLFIFRKDRRCLHDLIAGTKVVVAPESS